MATFNGIGFTADATSFQESREGRVAVQEIPGGDAFFVDLGGRSPLKWTVPCLLLNETVWGQLNSAIGTLGNLSIETLDGHQAVLLRLSRPYPFADGQVLATAEFIITDV